MPSETLNWNWSQLQVDVELAARTYDDAAQRGYCARWVRPHHKQQRLARLALAGKALAEAARKTYHGDDDLFAALAAWDAIAPAPPLAAAMDARNDPEAPLTPSEALPAPVEPSARKVWTPDQGNTGPGPLPEPSDGMVVLCGETK